MVSIPAQRRKPLRLPRLEDGFRWLSSFNPRATSIRRCAASDEIAECAIYAVSIPADLLRYCRKIRAEQKHLIISGAPLSSRLSARESVAFSLSHRVCWVIMRETIRVHL